MIFNIIFLLRESSKDKNNIPVSRSVYSVSGFAKACMAVTLIYFI